jgi:nitroreductase
LEEGLQLLYKRRSIRKYKDKPIEDHKINTILKSAMLAPSAGNEQPWHFIVIKDKKVMEEIMEVHPYSKMLREAPLAICVLGDKSLEKHKDFWVQDCSASTQNILLACEALGLGAVWLGVYPHMDRYEGVKKVLNIPEGIYPLSIVSIGYPDEEKPIPDRFIENRIHQNRW